METKIGSRNQEVSKNDGKNVVFDQGSERLWVRLVLAVPIRKIKGLKSGNRDSSVQC